MKKLLLATAFCGAAYLALAPHQTSTPHLGPQPTFQVGDVVQIDDEVGVTVDSPLWPGALGCYGRNNSKDDLINLIRLMRDRKQWPRNMREIDCGRSSAKWAYEIMEVADGTESYDHVYCVNSVSDFPINKSGCTWEAFPNGHVRVSSCKASRALTLDEIAERKELRESSESLFNITPFKPLPCLQETVLAAPR
jgi:hypothetical protein